MRVLPCYSSAAQKMLDKRKPKDLKGLYACFSFERETEGCDAAEWKSDLHDVLLLLPAETKSGL